MTALTIALVALPLLASIGLMTVARRARPTMVRRTMIVTCCGILLCAVWVALRPQDITSPTFQWLPTWHLFGLETGATGLGAILATLVALLLTLIHGDSDNTRYGVAQSAVLMLALGGANAAFLADHFVLRYAALEIVALSIPLALLAERPQTSSRVLGSNYILLRFGDAGLLLAILVLNQLTGTAHITSALAAAESLPVHLGWVAAGFLIAIWVKMGLWPLHIWNLAGRDLSLLSGGWLYAIVAPNLGLYLLYRVTPLLAATEGIRDVAIALAALAALISALYALLSRDIRASFSYAWSAVGCMAILFACTGLKSLVWLYIPALTLIRILLYLSSDAAPLARQSVERRRAALTFGLGGLGLAALGQLSGIWLRAGGIPAAALTATRISWGLLSAWLVLAFARLWAGQVASQRTASPGAVRWQASGIAGLALACSAVALPGLLRWLAEPLHLTFPDLPTTSSLASYAVAGPILWDSVLALVLVGLSRRLPALIVAWERIQSLIPERDIADRITDLAITKSLDAIRTTSRIVEEQILTELVERAAQLTVSAARWLHSNLEEASLESLLRGITRLVMEMAKLAQRLHTGRLRYNLAWVAVALAMAVLVAWFWTF